MAALVAVAMVSATPVTRAAASGSAWSPGFINPGVDGNVAAMVTVGTKVFVGGRFTHAGTVPANNIAVWDSAAGTWSALGSGLTRTACCAGVSSLALDGNTLDIGGSFDTAGGQGADGIAQFNTATSAWLPPLPGPTGSGTILVVAPINGQLLIGGYLITGMNGSTDTFNNIARWDGIRWNSFTDSTSAVPGVEYHCFAASAVAQVTSIVADGTGGIIIGGGFNTAGGHHGYSSMAEWDVASSTWNPVGNTNSSTPDTCTSGTAAAGPNGVTGGSFGTVGRLVASGSLVYTLGSFSQANAGTTPTPANNIAVWHTDSKSWSTLGNGVTREVDMVVRGSNVYVAGQIGNGSAYGVQEWNGTTWTQLGGAFDASSSSGFTVDALAVAGDGTVYAGGHFSALNAAVDSRGFTTGASPAANHIAALAPGGTSWAPLGSGLGLSNQVTSMATDGTHLYAAGNFFAGPIALNGVGEFDGTHWQPLGGGFPPFASAGPIAVDPSGTVYAVGTSADPSGNRILFVYSPATQQWSPLGGSFQGVGALATRGQDVYVGGSFGSPSPGGVGGNLAMWDGSQWSDVGFGVDGFVNTIAVSGNNVYVGGQFSRVGDRNHDGTGGGIAANNVAMWDGVAWHALGAAGSNGTDSSVGGLAVSGSTVYASGGFRHAGGQVVNNIAAWNGTSWVPLGEGLDGYVRSLAVSGSGLYVGGNFTHVVNSTGTPTPVYGVAFWNGSAWSALGTGLQEDSLGGGFANAMAVAGTTLYVGGYFQHTDGLPAGNIGAYGPVSPGPPLANGVATSIAVAASAQTLSNNQPVTLTAAVSPTQGSGAPGGSVTFSYNFGTVLGIAPLNNGVASLTTSAITAGCACLEDVLAQYPGDASFLPTSGYGSLVMGTPGDAVITTTSLPGGKTGTAYNATLQRRSGAGTYSWSLTNRGDPLPTGLSLDSATGAITGTPTQSGNFLLNVSLALSSSGVSNVWLPLIVPATGAGVNGSATALDSFGGTAAVSAGFTSTTPNTLGTILAGPGLVTVAEYGGNPAGPPPFTSGGYFDVRVLPFAGGTPPLKAAVLRCGMNAGNALEWWNAGANTWQPVGPASAVNFDATTGCTRFVAASSTSPTFAQLNGTPFAVATGIQTTAPAITSANHATFTAGVAGSFTVTTTGTPTPVLSVTGTLPAGVTFTDNHDGTAALSGTPGAGTAGPYPLTITANNGVGSAATQSFTLTVKAAASPGTFGSLAPTRLLDTRSNTGADGPVSAHQTVALQVTGRGGVPAGGVSAVTLNVTVTGPTTDGWVTVYADGTAPPTASNLNFVAGQTVPNLVVAPVGVNGKVDLTFGSSSNGGTLQLIADVAGYYVSGTPNSPGAFGSLAPTRLLDTRSNTGASGPVPAHGQVALQVAGKGGVPASGVSAVVLNVTVTGPQADGWITVYASGTTAPTASNLNFVAGQTVPNLVIAPVGSDGKVILANGSGGAGGTVQLIADVAGYYLSGTPSGAGAFGSLAPNRVLDTRSNTGANGPVAAHQTVALQVAGRGGVPASGVSAVVLNVTVTGPTSDGWITVYADGTTSPTASNLNFVAGQTVPNLVVAPVGADGKVDLNFGSSSSGGTLQLIADVAGYFAG
ncbi:MAG: Ig-like domain repeat protein [Candidatus Dormibacteraeota bacterium]|uniref:Ig-like domain repeat protein n=1 Tax=Candidatus Amunia macphersoniae TaxID=3127014 RepID=A0A934KH26_9BACT|nr:Ig-like domain repeat protein [Candidatus Dormibacteraeota bacterium]